MPRGCTRFSSGLRTWTCPEWNNWSISVRPGPIAEILRLLGKRADGSKTLRELIDEISQEMEEKGLDFLSPFPRTASRGSWPSPENTRWQRLSIGCAH